MGGVFSAEIANEPVRVRMRDEPRHACSLGVAPEGVARDPDTRTARFQTQTWTPVPPTTIRYGHTKCAVSERYDHNAGG